MTISVSRSMLLRDLTLSPEAPMAFCIRLLLQQMLWTGRSDELFELFGNDPRHMDLVDARNLLLRLGYLPWLIGLVKVRSTTLRSQEEDHLRAHRLCITSKKNSWQSALQKFERK